MLSMFVSQISTSSPGKWPNFGWVFASDQVEICWNYKPIHFISRMMPHQTAEREDRTLALVPTNRIPDLDMEDVFWMVDKNQSKKKKTEMLFAASTSELKIRMTTLTITENSSIQEPVVTHPGEEGWNLDPFFCENVSLPLIFAEKSYSSDMLELVFFFFFSMVHLKWKFVQDKCLCFGL